MNKNYPEIRNVAFNDKRMNPGAVNIGWTTGVATLWGVKLDDRLL